MSDEQLKAVSPIDGRYSKKVQHLREIFSESALMRYRVIAEITWLQYLSDCDQMDQIPSMDSQLKDALTKIHTDFSLSDAKKIKEIEKEINHDVKAVIASPSITLALKVAYPHHLAYGCYLGCCHSRVSEVIQTGIFAWSLTPCMGAAAQIAKWSRE